MTLRNTLTSILAASRRGMPGIPITRGQPGALAAAVARNGNGAAAASHAGDDEDSYAYGTDEFAARQHEKGRIRAILTSRAGLAQPRLARHLALNTLLPRNEVIAMLEQAEATAGRRASRLADRMNGHAPGVGVDAPGGPGKSSAAGLAGRILAAHAKARGGSR